MTSTYHQASSSKLPLNSSSPSSSNGYNLPSSTISLPFKGSFANLVRLIGLKKVNEGDGEDDEEEGMTDNDGFELGNDDADGDVDEESLLWDAQTALIAHHPDLAIKLYTQAALPPFCSSSACLALGNLLLRGSTLTENDHHSNSNLNSPTSSLNSQKSISPSSPSSSFQDSKSNTISSKIYNKLFGSPSTSSKEMRPTVNRKPTIDLVASGWQIPKEGKRAIRDSKSMGVAGAWFVLGLSWLVQSELEREKEIRRRKNGKNIEGLVKIIPTPSTINHNHNISVDDEELLSFDLKGKNKRTTSQPNSTRSQSSQVNTESSVQESEPSLSDSTDTICPPKSNPSSSSGRTLESPMVRTPGDALIEDPFNQDIEDAAKDLEVLQTMYDLLQPLLKLYRHGHIQSQDPVALPPISLSALPSILRPKNEAEKGRNVWRLGNVVAAKIVGMNLMKVENQSKEGELKEIERLRGGVNILINYVLGMTSQDIEAEVYFRNVISNPPTGFEMADDLIRQAAKRLDIITSSPRDEDSLNEYPFPTISTKAMTTTHLSAPKSSSTSSSPISSKSTRKSSLTNHARKPSTSSIASLSASRIFSTPMKSSASMASLCSISDGTLESVTVQLSESDCAVSSLKRVHARSMADLKEALNNEEEEEEEIGEPVYPSLNGWKLSPPAEDPTMNNFGVSQQSQRTIVPSHQLNNTSPKQNTYNTRGGISTSPTNTLRPIASSPQFGTLTSSTNPNSRLNPKSITASSTPRRKLPFEPLESQKINPIDPELAKAELSSALTKHVICGVCEMKGVNFPECRKCGLTFCSRDCRVGEDKAGNGKKHVCGLWESEKLLSSNLSDTNLVSSLDKSHINVERAVSPVRATRAF